MGRKTALRVALTITANETGRMWLRHKTADRLDYPSELAGVFHRKIFAQTVMSALMQINIVAARMWNFAMTQQKRRSKMNAADVMVTNVITVHPDASVKEIAEILLANRISALPVVDKAGSLVGIVSEADLIHRAEVGTERPSSWWLEFLAGKEALAQDFIKSHARRAADVMTRHVITVTADTPLTRIVSLLEKHRIKRVPVVDNGKVIGIVSRANLVQALLRSQQDISPRQPTEGSISGDDVVMQLEFGTVVARKCQRHHQ